MSKKSKQDKRVQRRVHKRMDRENRRREYESRVKTGTNSKRKVIAARKGAGRLVSDHKNPPPSFYVYVQPNRYGELHENR